MKTNIEFYDIQRTRQCEDTPTTSDSYIRGGLQLSCQNGMERSNTTCTTTREDKPRIMWWMFRQRLHISHVLKRTEKGYINSYSSLLRKL